MILRKLQASFGRLDNAELTLEPGLNIIAAPNESGKSTWCAFTRAMLYGIDSSERARAGYLPEKQRYLPWSGAPMQGRMELTAGGKDITLTRTTRLKSAPMREFRAVYTGTNTPVEGMTGTNAGEMLTGVSKAVFSRSAFVGQGDIAVTGNAELAQRIASIVSGGEEDCSFEEADETLRKWQRKRRYNSRGRLPELEARLSEETKTLESMSRAEQQSEELERELARARLRCTQLEEEMTEARRQARKSSLGMLTAARSELERKRSALSEATEQQRSAEEDCRRHPFAPKNAEEICPLAEQDADRADAFGLRAEAPHRKIELSALLFILLALLCASFLVNHNSIILAVFASVTAFAGIFLLLRALRLRRERNEARDAAALLLEKYPVSTTEELRSLSAQYRTLCEQRDRASAHARELEVQFDAADEGMRALEEAAVQELNFSSGSSEAVRIGRALAEQRSECDRIAQQLAVLRGRLEAVGDPMVLRSDIGTLREEHEVLEEEYAALSLAIETLRAADAELQSRFSPALGRLAAEYMGQMTGGRYTEVSLARDFTLTARTGDDIAARESSYLSAGTLDQLYLAVRLSVCKLAMNPDEPCPLIIDDAMVNFDAQRQEEAIRLLERIAEERQVILFTCK